MQTNDRNISALMKDIHDGVTQLPDFQRGWVWDNNRIMALIASITNNFPVGAAMFLEYGNENIRFKYRTIEGVETQNVIPRELILDGQQRLTSIYSSLFNSAPVKTKIDTNKDKEIYRYYYIDIQKSISSDYDRIDAIVSVPENRKIAINFGRDIVWDLSTQENEFKNKMFPLNIILDYVKNQEWQNKYYEYYKYDPEIIKEFTTFYSKIVMTVIQYKMPVILLDKNTPKEAVCQVFENDFIYNEEAMDGVIGK